VAIEFHRGDMFDLWDDDDSFDMLVITTNATVATRGGKPLPAASRGPMGRGCARQAAGRWPEFRRWWGRFLAAEPLTLFSAWAGADPLAGASSRLVGSLVTKVNWWQPSDPALVAASLQGMLAWLGHVHGIRPVRKVLMPLPGAGEGQIPPAVARELVHDALDASDILFVVCTL
jgi:hypothetical protein